VREKNCPISHKDGIIIYLNWNEYCLNVPYPNYDEDRVYAQKLI